MAKDYITFTWTEMEDSLSLANRTLLREEWRLEDQEGLADHAEYLAFDALMGGPFHDYLKAHGLIIDDKGVTFKVLDIDGLKIVVTTGLDVAEGLAKMVIAEYEVDDDEEPLPFNVWSLLELSSDGDVDYAGSYVIYVVDFIDKALGLDPLNRHKRL